jgi:hypothetical protein
LRKVWDLGIKEMSLEEKHDSLLDSFILTMATDYALFSELGELDRYYEFSVKVRKRMLPSLLGTAFKLFRAVAPGRAIKQVIEQYVYTQQTYLPLSNIELDWVSDREVIGRIRRCPSLKRLRRIVRKAGLNIDPRFHCEMEAKTLVELAKEFGVEATVELEKEGCRFEGKLK